MANSEPQIVYLIQTNLFKLASFRSIKILFDELDWVVPATATKGELAKALSESPFGTVFVIDEKSGHAVHGFTTSKDMAYKGKKKKYRKAQNNCESSCRAAHPECDFVLAIADTKGNCHCSCINFGSKDHYGAGIPDDLPMNPSM